MASSVSAYPAVRAHLLELQRSLAAGADVIMDGRDIGTCILPDADVKIYLSASPSVRAMRRYKELKEKGEACNLAEIEQDIIERDERDRNRAVSPLRQAEDAVYVDSSEMTIEQVVEAILAEARAKGLDAGSPASGGQTAGDQAAGGPVSKSQAPGDSDAGERERAGSDQEDAG